MPKLLKLSPIIYGLSLIVLRNLRFEFPDSIILQTINDISLEIFFVIDGFIFLYLDKEHRTVYIVIILLSFMSAAIKLSFM